MRLPIRDIEVADYQSDSSKIGIPIIPPVRRENSFEIYGARQIANQHNAPQRGELVRINNY